MQSRQSTALLILGLAGGLVSVGCGANSATSRDGSSPSVTGTSQAGVSRVIGVVVSGSGGATILSGDNNTPLGGVQVNLVNSGGGNSSAVTDSNGVFTLNNTPVGSNQLRLDNGSRGSVNVTTNQGMETNMRVVVTGSSANVSCSSQRPMTDTNADNACNVPTTGIPGNNGNNNQNGGGGNNGGIPGSGGNNNGGNNGGGGSH